MSSNGLELPSRQYGHSGQRTRREPFAAARTVQAGRLFKRLFAALALVASAWLSFQLVSIGDPRVLDNSGLIAESQFRFDTEQHPTNGDSSGVIASPAGWDLTIAWDAYPCQTAPTVRVDRGGTTDLVFHVTVGQTPSTPCSSMQAFHALDVRTSQPVDPADVHVDVIDPPRQG
jgi:hypothetical protein